MRKCFLKTFLPCLLLKKIKYKVSACLLETLTNSKDFSESRIKFLVPALLLSHWLIFSCVTLEGFSQLVSDFIKASKSFILDVLRRMQKAKFRIFWALKKFSS
jgi:hypothetical protein